MSEKLAGKPESLDKVIEAANKTTDHVITFDVPEGLVVMKLVKAGRPVVDEVQLAQLYAECADEDHELAEAGISDYAEYLLKEDTK